MPPAPRRRTLPIAAAPRRPACPTGCRARPFLLAAGLLLAALPASAQTATRRPPGLPLLRELNAAVEALTRTVSSSVVQVMVTAYGPVNDAGTAGAGLVIGRRRLLGSGVVIDADGYIMTNAHVVAGASRVQVVLPQDAVRTVTAGTEEAGDVVDARIVGIAEDLDLALLKVEATRLHPLALANYDAIQQGEVVFAFGSPEGLRNSVTMGVVSSVARQPDPDSPAVYIQTDTPINPGNSGGPLVNVEGELVGLNTLILSESGGSEGLGFAIPSAIVAAAYPQLRQYGRMHRGFVGMSTQAITPALAQGLGLARTAGVVVSDVLPGGAADAAGVAIGDVILAIGGKPVDGVPALALELNRYEAGDHVTLDVLKGSATSALTLMVRERPQPDSDLTDLADPETGTITRLGIIALDVTEATVPALPALRLASGVFVVARTEIFDGNDVPLLSGDVIHAINAVPVRTIDEVRHQVDAAPPHGTLVLQIERGSRLLFVTCEM